LTEIRDLLLIIAEPAIAKRDERMREALAKLVGNSKPKAKAVLLMDGSKSQSMIIKESGIDQGLLSRLSKALREASLIAADEKHPKLVIPIPPTFFEKVG
jgi:hypothetical protein